MCLIKNFESVLFRLLITSHFSFLIDGFRITLSRVAHFVHPDSWFGVFRSFYRGHAHTGLKRVSSAPGQFSTNPF